METSRNGLIFLIHEEAFVLTAYWDADGKVWTIGVGHTSRAGEPIPREGMKLTEAVVMDVFRRDLKTAEDTINKAVTAPIKQHEFDAYVALVHNIGPGNFRRSATLRHFNDGDREAAHDAFLGWTRSGSNKTILKPRREREQKIFKSADYGDVKTVRVYDVYPKKHRDVPAETLFIDSSAVIADIPRPVLRVGAKGPDVRELQRMLVAAGAPIVVDGDFGKKQTLPAVEAFQREHRLHVDGVVGKETWRALVEATASPGG